MHAHFSASSLLLLAGCLILSSCDRSPSQSKDLEQTATAKMLRGTEAEKQLSAAGLLRATLEAATEKEPPPLTTSKKLTDAEYSLIAGQDSNRNGIRDDIESKLVQSKRLSPRQRLALAQHYKANQSALLVDQSDDVAVSNAKADLLTGWQCVAENFGFNAKQPGIAQFLASLELESNNTPDRKNRFDNLGCDSVKVLLIDPEKLAKLKPNPCAF